MDLPEPAARSQSGDDVPADLREPAAAPASEPVLRPASRPLSRTAQFAILAVVAALLALGFGVGTERLPASESATLTEQRESNAPAGGFKPTAQQWAGFVIAPVTDRTFQPVQETDGRIAFDDDLTTPVFSPFTGRVTKLFARTGDRMKRGDKLLAVQAAEFVQGQNDLITAAAALKTARAQRRLAETTEKRQHALFAAQGAALKDWQQSQVDLATAEGAMHGAEIALGAVRNRLRILGKTDQEIDTLQDAPDAIRFDPEALILAPVDGVVTQRQIGLGQNIISQSSGGATAVFSIGDLSKVWLVGNAREADAALIHLGDAVEVAVPAYPDRVFKARISFVAASIDPSTHRLPVRAEVDNVDFLLKPEMLASFRITTGSAVTSPAVPASALVYEGAEAHVWVASEADRTVAIRKVEIGRSRDGMVQVLSGLRAGEAVVTAGSLFLDRAAAGG